MKIVLTIRTHLAPRAAIEKAIAGLVATTDEGAAIVAALEEVVGGPRCAPSTVEDVMAVLARVGSVKATAKALGIARSTVRARRARALTLTNPTIGDGADEWITED